MSGRRCSCQTSSGGFSDPSRSGVSEMDYFSTRVIFTGGLAKQGSVLSRMIAEGDRAARSWSLGITNHLCLRRCHIRERRLGGRIRSATLLLISPLTNNEYLLSFSRLISVGFWGRNRGSCLHRICFRQRCRIYR